MSKLLVPILPFDRPHIISDYSAIVTVSLSCRPTVSEILLLICQNLKRYREGEHTRVIDQA